jgi:rhamnosyltransferase
MNPLRILACIITYNGADVIRETLAAILLQSRPPDRILILDNASADNTLELVAEINSPDIESIVFSENKGVAHAYNYALGYARHHGFTGLWLFDQDTLCEKKCLEVLDKAAKSLLDNNEKSGALFPVHTLRRFPDTILFPNLWDGKRLISCKPFSEDESIREVHTSMTSGTLYFVDHLGTNELFREDFFIDFVDHEYHLRLRKKGYRFFWISDAHVSHSLGNAIEVPGYGVVIWHRPHRYYFMGRNMAWFFKREGGWISVLALLSNAQWQYRLLKAAGIKDCGLMRKNFYCGVLDGLLNRFKTPINPD